MNTSRTNPADQSDEVPNFAATIFAASKLDGPTLVGTALAAPNRAVSARFLLLADVIHMLVAGVALWPFLFTGTSVPVMFQLVITALIMLVMVRGGSWLVLGAMQANMLWGEARVQIQGVDLATVLTSAYCLAFVAYAAGFRTIRRWLRNWLGLILQTLFEAPVQNRDRSLLTELDHRRDRLADWQSLLEQSQQLLIRGARLLAVVAAASIAFVQLPIVQSGWNRNIDMDFQLWPGPNVFTMAILCMLIISLGSWRQLNSLQAKVYVKSLYVMAHFRELRSILSRSRLATKPSPRQTAVVKEK